MKTIVAVSNINQNFDYKWIPVHNTGVHTNCHLNTSNQHTVPGSEGGKKKKSLEMQLLHCMGTKYVRNIAKSLQSTRWLA